MGVDTIEIRDGSFDFSTLTMEQVGVNTLVTHLNGTLLLMGITADTVTAGDFTFFNPVPPAETPSEKQSAAVSENLGVMIDAPTELADVSEAPGVKASVSEDLSTISDIADEPFNEPFGDQDLIADFLAQGGGEKAPLIYTDADGVLTVLMQDDSNIGFAEVFDIAL